MRKSSTWDHIPHFSEVISYSSPLHLQNTTNPFIEPTIHQSKNGRAPIESQVVESMKQNPSTKKCLNHPLNWKISSKKKVIAPSSSYTQKDLSPTEFLKSQIFQTSQVCSFSWALNHHEKHQSRRRWSGTLEKPGRCGFQIGMGWKLDLSKSRNVPGEFLLFAGGV